MVLINKAVEALLEGLGGVYEGLGAAWAGLGASELRLESAWEGFESVRRQTWGVLEGFASRLRVPKAGPGFI